MEAYRFSVKISKNGTIKLPANTGLSDKEVEVIILPKDNNNKKQDFTASDFIEK